MIIHTKLQGSDLCYVKTVQENVVQNISLWENNEKYRTCYTLRYFNVFRQVRDLCESKQKYIHTLALIITDLRRLFSILTVKRPGREADHSPPASAEIKKTWIYTSTPPYVFMA
jgi:hypothetical protein